MLAYWLPLLSLVSAVDGKAVSGAEVLEHFGVTMAKELGDAVMEVNDMVADPPKPEPTPTPETEGESNPPTG